MAAMATILVSPSVRDDESSCSENTPRKFVCSLKMQEISFWLLQRVLFRQREQVAFMASKTSIIELILVTLKIEYRLKSVLDAYAALQTTV